MVSGKNCGIEFKDSIPMFTSEVLHGHIKDMDFSSPFWVAYSGGLDSHVLLHSLAQLRLSYPGLFIKAIHVHHSLSLNATQWSQHCQQICAALAIECVVRKIEKRVYVSEANLEAVARYHRYQIFSEVLPEKAYLFTAHHCDDQAETLLLRLLRGSGIKGLSAMSFQRPLGHGTLVRPFLHVARQSLAAYAHREKLIWVEDDSNECKRFDRNYLRHEIMPLLKRRWPAASTILSKTADHCRENDQLLQEITLADYSSVKDPLTNRLSIPALKKLSDIRQAHVLRYWFDLWALPIPSSRKLSQLIQDSLYSRQDAAPLLRMGSSELRRFKHYLYMVPVLAPHDVQVRISWDMKAALNLPSGIGILTPLDHQKILPDHVTAVTVRFRQGGERFRPYGRVGSHPLKKLFQEWEIPFWLRDKIPLIYVDDTLIIVAGYAVAHDWVACHGLSKKVLVEFKPGYS